MEQYVNKLMHKYLHWKWQNRWNTAWRRAERRARCFYHEDISHCNPWYYFQEELDELKR